jgi:hypothetical protein
LFLSREVEAPLPRIAESVWPFARVAVLLVPNVFFSPKPSLTSQGKHEFDYVSVTLAVDRNLLDVEYEGTLRLENAF